MSEIVIGTRFWKGRPGFSFTTGRLYVGITERTYVIVNLRWDLPCHSTVNQAAFDGGDEGSKSHRRSLARDRAQTTNLIKKRFTYKIRETRTKFSSKSKIKYLMTQLSLINGMFFILLIKYSGELSSLSSLLLRRCVFHNYLLGIFINI